MKKLLLLLTMAAAVAGTSSCIKDMDPFEGGDGVRVNINGFKCVMLGVPGNSYISHTSSGEWDRISASVEILRMLDGYDAELSFKITDTSPLIENKQYSVGSETMTVTLYNPSGAPGETVNLSGWIKFLKLDSDSNTVIEARFELDGTSSDGVEYALRHGFLRLRTKKTGE